MICANCVLPDTFPGISFNGEGVCIHCQRFDGKREKLGADKERYSARFQALIESLCGPSANMRRSYDVLMAYSGGKDSTYTLALLRRKYGLRVLALSFDNGFLSPAAVENIKRVTDKLGVDQMFFKPRWDLLKKIFRTASEKEIYPKKTLERASTICTSCMALVKGVCLRTAIEMGIPMIGYGWSPGQAPVQSSIMKTNPSLIRMTQETVHKPLREVAGEEVDAYFLGEEHYARTERFPWNIHPLAWEEYDEEMVLDKAAELGWAAPEDTDSNSTNCLLNAFANEVHIKKYGFHPYVWEIANMVRAGVMDRSTGLRKFDESSLFSGGDIVVRKLGLYFE